MAIRAIVKLGTPVLRVVTKKVSTAATSPAELKSLIADLIETMNDAHGIGIAAPQIGVNLQVAIISAKDATIAIINPKITRHSVRKSTEEEGCLSIPGVFGLVPRPRDITVSYLDVQGNHVTTKASGMLARVFQHEIDHLNGVLFIDRATRVTEGGLT